MKKNIYIIIGAVIIFLIAGWFVFSGDFWQAGVKKTNVVQETAETAVEKVMLVIDNGDGNPKIFTANFKQGITAFDLLKREAEKLSLALKTKNYDIGVLIEQIGDVKNGQDEKYWLYYVNGEMANVSADKKEIKAGDKVEFKFEKYGNL